MKSFSIKYGLSTLSDSVCRTSLRNFFRITFVYYKTNLYKNQLKIRTHFMTIKTKKLSGFDRPDIGCRSRQIALHPGWFQAVDALSSIDLAHSWCFRFDWSGDERTAILSACLPYRPPDPFRTRSEAVSSAKTVERLAVPASWADRIEWAAEIEQVRNGCAVSTRRRLTRAAVRPEERARCVLQSKASRVTRTPADALTSCTMDDDDDVEVVRDRSDFDRVDSNRSFVSRSNRVRTTEDAPSVRPVRCAVESVLRWHEPGTGSEKRRSCATTLDPVRMFCPHRTWKSVISRTAAECDDDVAAAAVAATSACDAKSVAMNGKWMADDDHDDGDDGADDDEVTVDAQIQKCPVSRPVLQDDVSEAVADSETNAILWTDDIEVAVRPEILREMGKSADSPGPSVSACAWRSHSICTTNHIRSSASSNRTNRKWRCCWIDVRPRPIDERKVPRTKWWPCPEIGTIMIAFLSRSCLTIITMSYNWL